MLNFNVPPPPTDPVTEMLSMACKHGVIDSYNCIQGFRDIVIEVRKGKHFETVTLDKYSVVPARIPVECNALISRLLLKISPVKDSPARIGMSKRYLKPGNKRARYYPHGTY